MTTSAGMPFLRVADGHRGCSLRPKQPYFCLSVEHASPKGTRSQSPCISFMYCACSAALSSEETKMTSKRWLSSLAISYAAASFGVKKRHGGHQCAEK